MGPRRAPTPLCSVAGVVPNSVCMTCIPCPLPSSLAANLLYDEGGKAIALAMKENRALTSLQ